MELRQRSRTGVSIDSFSTRAVWRKASTEKDDTYSYITILTASFNRLSPKMMVYNFGSTLYWLKIARMVTGSVAERVEPKMRHSINVRSRCSRPRKEYM